MNINEKLSLFLLQYRTTLNCTPGQSPADRFFHRHVCTRLDILKPYTKETVCKRQYQQMDHHDHSAADKSFSVDDAVYLRNTVGRDHNGIPGLVVRQKGPVSYEVGQRDSNTVHRRHRDQLRAHATAQQWWLTLRKNRRMVKTAAVLRTLLVPLYSHQSYRKQKPWLWGAQHKCVTPPKRFIQNVYIACD